MSKTVAFLLLIATIIPLALLLGLLAMTFAIPLEEQLNGGIFQSPVLSKLQFIVLVWTVLLALYYLFLVASNKGITQDRKLLWAIFMLAGGHVGMIAYWYSYIRPKKGLAGPAEDSALPQRP